MEEIMPIGYQNYIKYQLRLIDGKELAIYAMKNTLDFQMIDIPILNTAIEYYPSEDIEPTNGEEGIHQAFLCLIKLENNEYLLLSDRIIKFKLHEGDEIEHFVGFCMNNYGCAYVAGKHYTYLLNEQVVIENSHLAALSKKFKYSYPSRYFYRTDHNITFSRFDVINLSL
jgi:hypothetical protein